MKKTPKHFWKVLALSVATAPVLFIAFQNAAPADPCAGSALCEEIFTAMKAQPANEALEDAKLIDHAASRFGYGLSPLNRHVNGQNADTTDVRQVARFLADALDNKETFKSAPLHAMTPHYEFTLPKSGIKINPMTMTMTDVSDVQSQLVKLRQAAPDAEKKDFSRDITRMRGLLMQSSAEMRLLMNTFGSQRAIDGKFIEKQVDFNNVLEDFWFNHFNVDQKKVMNYSNFGADSYERTIFRTMDSTFANMLRSVIFHPAMITYLDNQGNKFILDSLSASNQNLGRELIELHTLGAGPGKYYEQNSVEGSALMLTGLNTFYQRVAPTHFGVRLFSHLHVPDTVIKNGNVVQTAPVIMGHRFCMNSDVSGKNGKLPVDCPVVANGATPEIREARMRRQITRFLNFLADHPRTRSNICNKLVSRFITARFVDDPDSDLESKKIEISRKHVIKRCINAWGVGGDLKAIYKTILTSPEVWNRHNYRTILKNPHELVISGVRSLGLDVRHFAVKDIDPNIFANSILQQIRFLGLPYRRWETPTGFKMGGSAWLTGGYLVRWTSGAFQVTNLVEHATAGKQTLPLLKLTDGQGLEGSRELAYAQLTTPKERIDFTKEVLGRLESYSEYGFVVRKMDKYCEDDTQVMEQLIGKSQTKMPFKTHLNLKLSNIFFLRK